MAPRIAPVDVAAADHRERVGAGAEDRRAGQRGDRLLAGVDQVGVDFVLGGERADAEQAVLGLQPHVHAGGHVVGDQRRQADAEVHVVAVAQFGRPRGRHLVTGPAMVRLLLGSGARVVRCSMRFSGVR
jgi:hypothetical protein